MASPWGNVGVVFDGGSFGGVYQIGEAEALHERGLSGETVYCQGVSVGALNAGKLIEAGFNKKGIAALKDIWFDLESRGPSFLFHRLDPAWRIPLKASSLFSDVGLDELVKHLRDPQKIIDSPIVFEVAVYNLSRGNEYTMFSNRDAQFKKRPERFVQAIKASASIPGIFPPVRIDDDFYGDGLHYSIERAIHAGCNTIFILTIRHNRYKFNAQRCLWSQQIWTPFDVMLDDYYKTALEKFSAAVPGVPYRIVPIFAEDGGETLTTVSFRKGKDEFKKAIKSAFDKTGKILDELEKTIPR